MTAKATLLRACWAERRAAFGMWLSTNGTSSAEALSSLGFDYIVIDLQHGLIDLADALAVMRALAGTNATVLCRVPTNEPGIIGRVLDAGAEGVIIPMVNDAAAAERAVSACRYAPHGTRSFGPTRARLSGAPFDTAEANATVLCIPMIETAEAVANIGDITAVAGIDALYVGPADLSLTIGLSPGGHHDESEFTSSLDAVLSACASNDVAAGIHANPALSSRRASEGFTMVTVTTDVEALTSGARTALRTATNST